MIHIVLIIVKNSKNEFYVHKRRGEKRVFPGYHGLGAGGVKEKNETVEEAAKRELFEELGINSEIKFLFEFYFDHKEWPHQLHTFIIEYEGPIAPTEKEFQWSGWMTKQRVDKLAKEKKLMPDTIVVWERFKRLFF